MNGILLNVLRQVVIDPNSENVQETIKFYKKNEMEMYAIVKNTIGCTTSLIEEYTFTQGEARLVKIAFTNTYEESPSWSLVVEYQVLKNGEIVEILPEG